MKKRESAKVKELKHQARRLSIKEGIFAAAKNSFGWHYISPFAIAINTSNSLVALLTSISGLLGPLSQTFSSRLIEKYPRKKIVTRSVFFESFFWLAFIGIAIAYYKGIALTFLPILLMIVFGLMVIVMNIPSPAWFSWMGDLVDDKYRGRWFSKRNLIIGFITVILAISASFFLDYFKANNWTMFGFIILFSLALIARLICWRIFKKKYEPKIKLKKGYYFSFSEFLIQAPKNNFGRFSLFRAWLGFTSSISGPLIAVYLLRYLEFKYSIYMIVIFAGTVFSLLFLNLWGKLADKYGNYRVLCITTIFIPMVPILWILHPSPIYLAIVPSIVGGIAWAGFNLSAGNFIYDNVTTQKRGLAVSYYNMLNGIGIGIGAGIGALLIKFLTIDFIEPIIAIFILGSIARMLVVFWWIPKFKEIKKTKKFNSSKVLKNIIFKQAKPILAEEAHEIMSIKDYLRE